MNNGHTAKKMHKVMLVDDHPIIRHAISQTIQREKDLCVCGQAGTAEEALAVARAMRPDVAVVDLSLHDGNSFNLIEQFSALWPKMLVLVLSMHNMASYVRRAFRCGAKGYVTKGEPASRVAEAIHKILQGEIYISEKLPANVVDGEVVDGDGASRSAVDVLSPREFEIFELIGKGLQTQQIAQQLNLSANTVGAHRENIKRKLHLTSSIQVAKAAIEWVLSRPQS